MVESPVRTLLLVEDDDDHAELFMTHLAGTSFAGSSVIRAVTMGEGRAVLEKEQVDLAFIDLTLPDSGIEETLEVLSQLASRAPIIVITALDDRRTLLDIIAHGADDCVPKIALSDTALERTIRFNLDRWRLKQQSIQAERDKYTDLLVELQRVGKVGFWELDIADMILTWSDEVFHIFEIPKTAAPIRYADFLAAVHPDDRERVDSAYRQSLENRETYAITHRLLLPDGRTKYVLEQCKIQFSESGKPATLSGTVLDITASKQTEQQLRLAASVFSHASEGIMITDPDGAILNVNDAFTRITGYSRDEALGRNPRLLKSGLHDADFYKAMWRKLREKGNWAGEIWNRRKNGDIYPGNLRINGVRNNEGTVQHYVALFSDITAEKAHQRQLEKIAHYDALTNLPNRVLLADRLRQAMLQEQRRGQQLAVAYLDLDGFKDINDSYGHDTGDQVLIAVSARLKNTLREGDTIARLGGDEFVAVLIDLSSTNDCIPLLERMLSAAALPVRVNGQDLQVSASLGVTFYPQREPIDADQLLRQADQAMYHAKQAGKNCFQVFDAEQESIRGRVDSFERKGAD